MRNKRVPFSTRPVKPERAVTPDQWVETRAQEEPVKRLAIDIPASLHSRIKAQCALRGTKMVDAITELLEREFPVESKQ